MLRGLTLFRNIFFCNFTEFDPCPYPFFTALRVQKIITLSKASKIKGILSVGTSMMPQVHYAYTHMGKTQRTPPPSTHARAALRNPLPRESTYLFETISPTHPSK